jgi:hypothetical protein
LGRAGVACGSLRGLELRLDVPRCAAGVGLRLRASREVANRRGALDLCLHSPREAVA